MLNQKKIQELWTRELVADHRWGRMRQWFKIDDNEGENELIRLKMLWQHAQPLGPSSRQILEQIISLEICNWRLEESVLKLYVAIGRNKPIQEPIGHMSSFNDTRWKQIWAYYLTLRHWLPCEIPSSYETLLTICYPDRKVQKHILKMLGKRNRLKELYVERFCLCLEYWLGGCYPKDSPQGTSHSAAVAALEKRIEKHDSKCKVLHPLALKDEGMGKLNLCNHKLFYRYDLVISSIGAGKWRAAMGRRVTDGLSRAKLLEKYLKPIENWVQRNRPGKKASALHRKIFRLLGKPDHTKTFLASLLVSLLRSQQLAAEWRARKRLKEQRKESVRIFPNL